MDFTLHVGAAETTINPLPGRDWTLATQTAAFPGRILHKSISYADKMWVIGGHPGGDVVSYAGAYQDVWSSPDGVNWTQVTAAAAFGKRLNFDCAVFNNNPAVSKGPGIVAADRLGWIEAELKRGAVTFLFCHVQLLEKGTGPLWGASAEAVASLCTQYGVPAVAYGHRHELHLELRDGTVYIMGPDLKVAGHQWLLQYRLYRKRFEVWQYDVCSGDSEPLGGWDYPARQPLRGRGHVLQRPDGGTAAHGRVRRGRLRAVVQPGAPGAPGAQRRHGPARRAGRRARPGPRDRDRPAQHGRPLER